MAVILIADDEADIRSALEIYLKAEGYGTVCAEDGKAALDCVVAGGIDLVLLDIMMPVMDGITALSKIRGISNVPVIMLTARAEDADKIMGLNVGADDYITKPFLPAELIARVRSQLRRYMTLGGNVASGHAITIGSISLDDDAKRVAVDGSEISLTPVEYSILKLLMEHPGHVYSSTDIYRQVWHESPYGSRSAVAVHIRHLREKIEIDPAQPRYLKVVWGQGYRMEAPAAEKKDCREGNNHE